MSRSSRPGLWPRLGDYIMVRDSDTEPWKRKMSAGGGYYFHDDYGTKIWPIKQWKVCEEQEG